MIGQQLQFRRWREDKVVLAIAVVSALMIAVAFLWNMQPEGQFREEGQGGQSPNLGNQARSLSHQAIEFIAAREAPLFHALRAPKYKEEPDPIVEPVVSRPVLQLDHVHLLGIVTLDDQPDFAFLQIPNMTEPLRVSIGAVVNGWVVEDLQIDSITFAQDGQLLKKTIIYKKEAEHATLR